MSLSCILSSQGTWVPILFSFIMTQVKITVVKREDTEWSSSFTRRLRHRFSYLQDFVRKKKDKRARKHYLFQQVMTKLCCCKILYFNENLVFQTGKKRGERTRNLIKTWGRIKFHLSRTHLFHTRLTKKETCTSFIICNQSVNTRTLLQNSDT